jgi:hypothetical protein
MRLVIVGPRKSGKSILLGELANQFAIEMLYTGEWKSTFIFALDVIRFLPLLDDYPKLLDLMVTQVLDAIAAQKPGLRELLASAKKKFAGITDVGVALAPIPNRTILDGIAKKIGDVWRDPDGFFRFFSWVFQLPTQIAKAVGVENTVIVADNIDLGDIQLTAQTPFTEASGFLFLIELLKYALENANFIVACQDTDRCCQIMAPTHELGTDLLEGINFVSTMDIGDQDFLDEGDFRFAAEVEGDQMPLQLDARLCGGVEHFVTKWKELCNVMGRLDSCRPGDDDDALFAAVNAAQEFVSLVFDPDQEIHILNVARLPEDRRL